MNSVSRKAPSFSPPVLVLFGPTASGKTALLEGLFAGPRPLCRAEVISADSMQVYRGMDIGTAKPGPELRRRLPHHLIDIRNPDEPFNAGDFVRLAGAAAGDIIRRGAEEGRFILPVVSGGTGFYLAAFIRGLPESPPSDRGVREALRAELARKGAAALMDELARLDPVSARNIHVNDRYRLLRALEVCRMSGRPLSSFAQNGRPGDYRFLIVEIRRNREDLYRNINQRCGEMFRRGLPEEVRGLHEKGYTPDDPGLRAIGYREFFVESPGTDRPWTLSADTEGVKALVARNSRRYAKRQETFFASLPETARIDGSGAGALDLLGSLVHTFLKS
ncbi:MAG: tRNA (adenosine(37)-N6)-dimethylallyltransferase MiaA [Treponema sp.]|nr:tRNA (adenosine(37)-N6)-dimethylallyltransferase MiaA [Treponema sp.]